MLLPPYKTENGKIKAVAQKTMQKKNKSKGITLNKHRNDSEISFHDPRESIFLCDPLPDPPLTSPEVVSHLTSAGPSQDVWGMWELGPKV